MYVYSETTFMNGVSRTYAYANGLRISVVKHDFSYGGLEGLWEIAALDEEGDFITSDVWYNADDDVIGWVTDEQLTQYLTDAEEWDSEYDPELDNPA